MKIEQSKGERKKSVNEKRKIWEERMNENRTEIKEQKKRKQKLKNKLKKWKWKSKETKCRRINKKKSDWKEFILSSRKINKSHLKIGKCFRERKILNKKTRTGYGGGGR